MSSLRFSRYPVLALFLLMAFALLWPETASAATYGCGICGHGEYSPWHNPGCPYYGLGLGSSSGGSSGGYQGSSGGEALGNALGALIDRFFERIAEQQQRAAALAAERRRQEALARERERQRQEQLRRARIRLAARLRADWDRRDAGISQRLAGVFDVFVDSSVVDLRPDPLPGGTSFFGLGGSEPFVDSSVVDLRPEPTAQQRLESLRRFGGYAYELPPAIALEVGILTGRTDPAFLEAQEERATATDAFATGNYGFSRAALGEAGPGDGPGGEIVRELLTATDSEALGAKLKALGSRALDGAGDAARSGLAALEENVAGLPLPGLAQPAAAAEAPAPRNPTPPAPREGDGTGPVAAGPGDDPRTTAFGGRSVSLGEVKTAPREYRPRIGGSGTGLQQLESMAAYGVRARRARSIEDMSDLTGDEAGVDLGGMVVDTAGRGGKVQIAEPSSVEGGPVLKMSEQQVRVRLRQLPKPVYDQEFKGLVKERDEARAAAERLDKVVQDMRKGQVVSPGPQEDEDPYKALHDARKIEFEMNREIQRKLEVIAPKEKGGEDMTIGDDDIENAGPSGGPTREQSTPPSPGPRRPRDE